MERDVIIQLGFDFDLVNPEMFIDRYLRVTDYHTLPLVRQLAIKILTLHYVDERLLKHPLSKIAACSVILAINITKMKQNLPN